jgi:hypothetical protein
MIKLQKLIQLLLLVPQEYLLTKASLIFIKGRKELERLANDAEEK